MEQQRLKAVVEGKGAPIAAVKTRAAWSPGKAQHGPARGVERPLVRVSLPPSSCFPWDRSLSPLHCDVLSVRDQPASKLGLL